MPVFVHAYILLQGSKSNFWNDSHFFISHHQSCNHVSRLNIGRSGFNRCSFSAKIILHCSIPRNSGIPGNIWPCWPIQSSVVKRESPGLWEEKLLCNLSAQGLILLFRTLAGCLGRMLYTCVDGGYFQNDPWKSRTSSVGKTGPAAGDHSDRGCWTVW